MGWLYEIDGEEFGPVNFRTLRSLAVSKKLLGHHLVWKEGSDQKEQAGGIMGLIPASNEGPPKPPQPQLEESDDPYAAPRSGSIAEGPPGGLYLPHLSPANLYLYLGLLAVSAGLIYYSTRLDSPNTVTFLLALAGFSLIGWIVLSAVYLHRSWEMMRMLGAHLTGTKAVRFLFIPLFNALWCFVAVFGWARLWNHNVKHHPGLKPAKPVWTPLFFIFPVFFLVSQGLALMYGIARELPTDLQNQSHQISLGVWGLSLLVTLITWGQLIRSINFPARKKT